MLEERLEKDLTRQNIEAISSSYRKKTFESHIKSKTEDKRG